MGDKSGQSSNIVFLATGEDLKQPVKQLHRMISTIWQEICPLLRVEQNLQFSD
jgi:Protein of unknown function (DUF3083).